MDINNFEFFINNFSSEIKTDFSFLPMLVSRKLSKVDKCALSTMYDCYTGDCSKIVFSSRFGEHDRLIKLTNQFIENNEVSPTFFSSSVHNFPISTFSLLNKINSSYTSLASGENTISSGLIEAISSLVCDDNVLFCYADSYPFEKSIAILFGKVASENSIKVKINTLFEKENNYDDEYLGLINFLNKKSNSFLGNIFKLERVD